MTQWRGIWKKNDQVDIIIKKGILTIFLYLLINCISIRSAPQFLSIKELWHGREAGPKLLFCEWSFFWMAPKSNFTLPLKLKSKTIKFNPLRSRFVIWQLNEKPNNLSYLKNFNWCDSEILGKGIFPKKVHLKHKIDSS